MVHEILSTGSENARTGRELAGLLHCDIRTVTEQIERERRDGQPICANMRGEYAGYFLAETPDELERYCNQLYKRGGELFKTRRALLATLEKITGQEAAEDGKAVAGV